MIDLASPIKFLRRSPLARVPSLQQQLVTYLLTVLGGDFTLHPPVGVINKARGKRKGQGMAKPHRDIETLVKLFSRLEKKRIKRARTGSPHRKGSAPRARWSSLFKGARQGASVVDYISSN